ncbi:hypothetical protein [Alteribacillus bidgolensis]|uniref:Uncharacterized protein n=1 Tax=Alteribacillus bidgolensis TaxID=930129 RepID=A0A1G8P5L4_9BACI|nr:hypothetical protein [Alteribacillus bidgolensis]SDI87781.1 hypothetical protein SAMN05216352_113131 [Alteribacillus bidgolensis]
MRENKLFKVNYTFQGNRTYTIKQAKSKEQAEEMVACMVLKARNINAEEIDGMKEM